MAVSLMSQKEKKKHGTEKVFFLKMVENFLNLAQDINLEI